MSLGRSVNNERHTRDIESDYTRALTDEYRQLVHAGHTERAAKVAAELKGRGAKKAPEAGVKERAVAADAPETAIDEPVGAKGTPPKRGHPKSAEATEA